MRLAVHSMAALVLAFALQAAHAEEPAAYGILRQAHGPLAWQRRSANSMAADMRMHWEPVLDGQFQRLSMEDQMTGADGKTWHFKAQGYYRVGKDGTITGTWFDSRGISLPLTGRVEGDTMTIDWGTEASSAGAAATAWRKAPSKSPTRSTPRKASFSVFGRTRLTRGRIKGTLPFTDGEPVSPVSERGASPLIPNPAAARPCGKSR